MVPEYHLEYGGKMGMCGREYLWNERVFTCYMADSFMMCRLCQTEKKSDTELMCSDMTGDLEHCQASHQVWRWRQREGKCRDVKRNFFLFKASNRVCCSFYALFSACIWRIHCQYWVKTLLHDHIIYQAHWCHYNNYIFLMGLMLVQCSRDP